MIFKEFFGRFQKFYIFAHFRQRKTKNKIKKQRQNFSLVPLVGKNSGSDVEGRLAVGGWAEIHNSIGQNMTNWTCTALRAAGEYENVLVVRRRLQFAPEVCGLMLICGLTCFDIFFFSISKHKTGRNQRRKRRCWGQYFLHQLC